MQSEEVNWLMPLPYFFFVNLCLLSISSPVPELQSASAVRGPCFDRRSKLVDFLFSTVHFFTLRVFLFVERRMMWRLRAARERFWKVVALKDRINQIGITKELRFFWQTSGNSFGGSIMHHPLLSRVPIHIFLCAMWTVAQTFRPWTVIICLSLFLLAKTQDAVFFNLKFCLLCFEKTEGEGKSLRGRVLLDKKNEFWIEDFCATLNVFLLYIK